MCFEVCEIDERVDIDLILIDVLKWWGKVSATTTVAPKVTLCNFRGIVKVIDMIDAGISVNDRDFLSIYVQAN